MNYILIGPPDPESDDNLYWSNETGWGNYAGATQFPPAIFNATLPPETVAIAEITEENKIGLIHEVVSPTVRVVALDQKFPLDTEL